MILKGDGLTMKSQSHFGRRCLLSFLCRFANMFAFSLKNKGPDAAHQGFVVAETGLLLFLLRMKQYYRQ